MRTLLLSTLLLLSMVAHAQWNAFGTGFTANDYVVGFTPYNGDLLAYTFPSPLIYVYDGSGTWTTPMPPVPNSNGIHRLLVADSVLYAASYSTGTFNQFYKYENGAWVQMGLNFRNWASSGEPNIYDAIIFQDTLYICGEFARNGTDTIYGVAKWADSTWLPLGEGLVQGLQPNGDLKYPHQMIVYNNELVVVGNFKRAGGQIVNGIAAWNGSTWHGFADGFNRAAYGAGIHNNELYVCGEFTLADSHAVRHLAKWDGTTFVDPGVGVEGVNLPFGNAYIHSLLSFQGRLYIAGGFNRIWQGNTQLMGRGVFAWNGSLVDLMDGGVTGDVEALMPYQDGLLIGGDFVIAGGNVVVDHVAYYDLLTHVQAPNSNALQVYPTRFTDGINVTGVIGQADAPSSIRLIDLHGRVLQAGPLQSTYVSMVDCPAGMYLLQIWQGDALLHRQLLEKVRL